MFMFGKLYLIKQAKLRQNLKLRPRIVVVRETTNDCIDNPSDYWRISLHLAFLDHLVEEISKRVVSNKERFFASYLKPANSLNITPEINDRLFNVHRTDLSRKAGLWMRLSVGKSEGLLYAIN